MIVIKTPFFHSVSSFFSSFWHEGCNDILGIKKETSATRSNDQTNRREGSEFLIDHWGYSRGRADPSLQSLSDVNPKLLLVGSQAHFIGKVNEIFCKFRRIWKGWLYLNHLQAVREKLILWMGERISCVSSLRSSSYVVCPGIIYPITSWIVLVIFKVCKMVTKEFALGKLCHIYKNY